VPIIIKNESTYETFSRYTQEQPWKPFKPPSDAARFSEADNAEHAMFEEMQDSYDRNNKRLDSARGYKSFARAWNLRMSNLYKEKLDGKEDVLALNRKSCKQLQQHFDEMKKHEELKAMSQKNDCPLMRRAEEVFRQTRHQMAPHQTATTCTPVDYNLLHLGRPQFGAPFALNTEIAANAFQYNQHNETNPPIVYKAPPLERPVTVARSLLGPLFLANTCCWKCGHRRKKHNQLGVPFGDHCHSNCLHEQCSKCWERLQEHNNGIQVGPFCTKLVNTEKSDYSKWWKSTPPNQTGII